MIEKGEAPLASWIETRRGLLCLLTVGLVIRLILARHSEGLPFDVSLFRQWANRLVQNGPAHFYAPGYFADYAPGYLYVLFGLGSATRALTGELPSIPVLKLPAIAADLGVAVLAWLFATRVAQRSSARRIPVRALAAAAVLLNPGLILVSAVWGQVDSVLALLVLAGIYALSGRPTVVREACGVTLLAMAVATKPQAVLALPVAAILLARRHLVGDRSASRTSLPRVGRLALLVVLGGAVVMAMFAPFGLGPTGILAFYRSTGSVYPFTSLWAFNTWGAVGFYRPDVGPEAVNLVGIVAFGLGLVAFGVAVLALMVQAWRALARGVNASAVALFGTLAVTCVGFALLTRMHERYLHLAVVGLAPLVAGRPFRWALVIVSMCFLLNVHFVYVFHSQHSLPPGGAWTIQPAYDALFGRERDAFQLKTLSAITATACLAVAFLGWQWLEPRAD